MIAAPKEKSIMRILATSSLIAVGLMLSGCGDTSTINRSVDSVHQPVVQRTDFVFDVNTSGNGLAGGEANRLRGWLDNLRVGYGDKIAVDSGESGNTGAVNTIASVVGNRGIRLETNAPVTQGAIAPGAVRVIVSRMTASVPGCPDYRESFAARFNAASSTNYGCASNATLAAMIANPEDLVHGRDAGNGTAATASANATNKAAIDKYYTTVGQSAGTVKSESK